MRLRILPLEECVVFVATIRDILALAGHAVAAFTPITRNPAKGWDWLLEYKGVNAASLFFNTNALSTYEGIIAFPTITVTSTIGNPTLEQATTFTIDVTLNRNRLPASPPYLEDPMMP